MVSCTQLFLQPDMNKKLVVSPTFEMLAAINLFYT